MSKTRVTPWQDKDPVPADLLRAMQARRPNGELIGIDRVLLKSVPLATGWNELLSRVRADFSPGADLSGIDHAARRRSEWCPI